MLVGLVTALFVPVPASAADVDLRITIVRGGGALTDTTSARSTTVLTEAPGWDCSISQSAASDEIQSVSVTCLPPGGTSTCIMTQVSAHAINGAATAQSVCSTTNNGARCTASPGVLAACSIQGPGGSEAWTCSVTGKSTAHRATCQIKVPA